MDLIFGTRKVEGALTGTPAVGEATLPVQRPERRVRHDRDGAPRPSGGGLRQDDGRKARFRMVLVTKNGA